MKHHCRAVDKLGQTVNFLLTAKRDMAAAKRFVDEACGSNGNPEKIAMERRGANTAAIDATNVGRDVPTECAKSGFSTTVSSSST